MSAPEAEPLAVQREYTLLQPIGRGAMGTVFDAIEPSTGHQVAVKVLNRELIGSSDVRARFIAEAITLITVDHPGSIPVYGMGTLDDDCPFFVMKKIQGRTLRDLLVERGDRKNDLTWRRRLLDIFEYVCETVAYAHANGIVHRDLKPENILIDDNGAVFVIDWGLAKRTVDAVNPPSVNLTHDGTIMGSPGYLSPEQACGDSSKVGPPGDVFALGVILYEILTGKQPFTAEHMRQSILSVIHREPEDPRRLALLVTRTQSAICRKALNKDPQRRYATAAELRADLNALRGGRPVSVRRRTLFEKGVAWYRRNPFRFALVLSVALALLMGGLIIGGQFWLDHRLADEAYERVESLDSQIDVLRSEISQLEREIVEISPSEHPAVDAKIRQLSTQLILCQMEAFYLARSVVQLRFIRTEAGALRLRRQRYFDTVRAALDFGEPEFAWALANLVLERDRQDLGKDVSEADLERLGAMRSEAEAALVRRTESQEGGEPERR